MRRAFFTGLLHIALVTIVIGACVTHFFGEQGEVHLRYNEATSLTTRHSTLSLFLWDFQILYADDGQTPKDFVSELRILDRGKGAATSQQQMTVDAGSLRMNKPLRYHNYRFCQSDYDSDGLGVVLSYNYDPWGIGLTYAGYAMLLLAMIGFFFQKRTYFRSLLRKQHTWLMVGLGVFVLVMAVVMTRVVTPKPPLQPVLQTPLLGIHVSVIMLAYTLFAVIMVNGIIGLCAPARRDGLMQLSQVLLYPALFSLTAGIFIGAVWANLSWGRYWGWDPKETWALITMLVYAALLHLPFIKFPNTHVQSGTPAHSGQLAESGTSSANQRDKRAIIYHVFSIIAFFFVLFTYFGVNRLLGGLHSYAN